MTIYQSEKQVLLYKYKKEGLSKKEIERRFKEMMEFEEYVKFAKKYLNVI